MKNRLRLVSFVLLAATLAWPAHADSGPTIAEILDITYATGHRMRAAGFDRAENIRYDEENIWYDPETDTVGMRDFTLDHPEMMKEIEGVDLTELHTTIAAHEHCHGFLLKGRPQLPRAVAQADDACSVMPVDRYESFFDEIFCDLAAINVVGKSSEQIFERHRKFEDAEREPDSIDRYLKHSYPIFRLAIAANDHSEPNPVTRSAKAMEAACSTPEVQALIGVKEREFSKRLTDKFAEFTVVPKDQIAPVTLPTVKEWRSGEGRPFEKVWGKTGDGPPMFFARTYHTCRAHFATHGLPTSPWPERAMQRCTLNQEAFDKAYCVAVSNEVASRMGDVKHYRPVTDQMFGRESLASRIVQDDIDYRMSVYDTEEPNNPKNISLRIEFACGAKPEELAEVMVDNETGSKKSR